MSNSTLEKLLGHISEDGNKKSKICFLSLEEGDLDKKAFCDCENIEDIQMKFKEWSQPFTALDDFSEEDSYNKYRKHLGIIGINIAKFMTVLTGQKLDCWKKYARINLYKENGLEQNVRFYPIPRNKFGDDNNESIIKLKKIIGFEENLNEFYNNHLDDRINALYKNNLFNKNRFYITTSKNKNDPRTKLIQKIFNLENIEFEPAEKNNEYIYIAYNNEHYPIGASFNFYRTSGKKIIEFANWIRDNVKDWKR